MQRQRPKKRVAQISFLFVATKMLQEQGNGKHSEQKVLVSLLLFKSQNTHQTQSMQGQIHKTALQQDTELVCWEKSQCCFSAAAREQLGFHPCPRAITTTASLQLASKGFRCPCRKQLVTFQTLAANYKQFPICAFLTQQRVQWLLLLRAKQGSQGDTTSSELFMYCSVGIQGHGHKKTIFWVTPPCYRKIYPALKANS